MADAAPVGDPTREGGPEPRSGQPGPWARLLADFAAMVRFYSRLPLPRLGPADDPAAMPDFALAARMLPIAGLVIAAPAAFVLALLGETHLPPLAIAGFAVAVALATTGAFHEDGLADIADGFGGGATRERRLEIMKDSRIGAFGGAALVLSILLKAALYGGLVGLDGHEGWGHGGWAHGGWAQGGLMAAAAALAVAPASRVLPLILFRALPPARADGLGRSVGVPSRATLGIALGIAALAMLGFAGPWFGIGSVGLALVAGAVGTAGLGWAARRAIGGQTGDVLGAGQPITEILMLAALAA